MKRFRFNSRLILFVALLGFDFAARADLASIFTNVHAPVAMPQRPSIIYIQCHGLGFGDLSCYGQTNFQTPNLDQLAAQGIRFNNYTPGDTNVAAVQSAWLTGKTGGSTDPNIAEILRHAGYRTAFFGEWSLASQPWQQGFDDFGGFLDDAASQNYYPDHLWRFAPRAVINPTNGIRSDYSGSEMIYANMGGKKGKYGPDLFFKTAVNFVRNNEPDKYNRYRPFFLVLNLPAPRTATAGKDDFPVPTDAPYSDEAWPQAAKNRAALLTHIDGGIGSLLEQLGKNKMTNNVVIFFSSSAPTEKFADPKLNFFRTAADASADNIWRAPMIVRWPEHIPAGQVSDQNWSAVDFLPTAADLGFVNGVTHRDGKSVLPLLLGKKPLDQP